VREGTPEGIRDTLERAGDRNHQVTRLPGIEGDADGAKAREDAADDTDDLGGTHLAREQGST
jgi:hypothetical protein